MRLELDNGSKAEMDNKLRTYGFVELVGFKRNGVIGHFVAGDGLEDFLDHYIVTGDKRIIGVFGDSNKIGYLPKEDLVEGMKEAQENEHLKKYVALYGRILELVNGNEPRIKKEAFADLSMNALGLPEKGLNSPDGIYFKRESSEQRI